MSNPVEVVVLVKLKANLDATGPSEEGALLFAYSPDPNDGSGAIVESNGNIDLRSVKSEVKIAFQLINTESLIWRNGKKYIAYFKEGDSTDARDALWIARGQKPTQRFPLSAGNNEFDTFQHSAWNNETFSVRTKNTDTKEPYCYLLAVYLLEDAANAKPILYRDDPQIRNGGNSFYFRFMWPIAIAGALLTGAISGLMLGKLFN